MSNIVTYSLPGHVEGLFPVTKYISLLAQTQLLHFTGMRIVNTAFVSLEGDKAKLFAAVEHESMVVFRHGEMVSPTSRAATGLSYGIQLEDILLMIASYTYEMPIEDKLLTKIFQSFGFVKQVDVLAEAYLEQMAYDTNVSFIFAKIVESPCKGASFTNLKKTTAEGSESTDYSFESPQSLRSRGNTMYSL